MKVHITPESKVVTNTQITCYEVDRKKRLRPGAFMDLAQEMAYLAAEAMHFGYDELATEGRAWVLSRMHFTFVDVPHWRDSVELATWHKGPYGPFYLRDFCVKTENDGKVRVLGTSSWVILNVDSRHMVRTSEVVDMIPTSTICPDHAIAEPASKVAIPKGVEPMKVGEHKVEYSDVDLLGHTNNVKYVVWALDAIGFEVADGLVMKDLTINFNHETVAGETVSLFMFKDEGESLPTYYVEGKVEDRQVFCLKVVFREED